MAYLRGSEEANRGNAYGSYDPATLQLMREQQARMMGQQQDIGGMAAEGVASSGQDLGRMIGSAPGAYMQGAQFRQASDRNTTAQRSADINLGAQSRKDQYAQQAKQTVDPNTGKVDNRSTEQRLWDAGLSSEEGNASSVAARGKMDKYSTDYSLGAGANGAPRINQSIDAGLAQPVLQNKLTNAQIAGVGNNAADRNIERAATLYGGGNQAGGDAVQLSPTDRAYAQALGKQKAAGAVASQNILGANSALGGQNIEDVRNLNPKVQNLKLLASTVNEFKSAPTGSEQEARAQEKMDQLLQGLGESSTKNALDPRGWDIMGQGGLKPRTRGEQAQAALSRARSQIEAEVSALERTSGQNASPDVKNTIQQYRQVLANMDRDQKKDALRQSLKIPAGGIQQPQNGYQVPANYQPIFVPPQNEIAKGH